MINVGKCSRLMIRVNHQPCIILSDVISAVPRSRRGFDEPLTNQQTASVMTCGSLGLLMLGQESDPEASEHDQPESGTFWTSEIMEIKKFRSLLNDALSVLSHA